MPFRDQGRSFYLLTALGTDVDEFTRRQTVELLDSLTFEPAKTQP